MGLDYCMCFIIDIEKKENFYQYIKNHGELNIHNKSCTLEVDLDFEVVKYLQGSFEWSMANNMEQEYQTQTECYHNGVSWKFNEKVCRELGFGMILPNYKARIGNFEIYEEVIDSACLIQLFAVTTDMSFMLKKSNTIHSWLVNCAKKCMAELAYFDYEEEAHIYWYKDHFVSIPIGTSFIKKTDRNEFLDIIKLFTKYINF